MTNSMPETSPMTSGHGIPVDLSMIETELTKLWGPAARRAGGPEVERPNMTRVALANLIVASTNEFLSHYEPVLQTVVHRRPCRTIVLNLSVDDGPVDRVSAEVDALCHLPAPGRPQVCSERIRLTTAPCSESLLTGATRSVLDSSLPTILWWIGDPRPRMDLFVDLAQEIDKLIIDVPRDVEEGVPAIQAALGHAELPQVRDVAWYGITGWRMMIASFFDEPESRQRLHAIRSVRIVAVAHDRRRPPRSAVWLTAWLSGQLGWTPDACRRTNSNGEVHATFHGPHGPIEVQLVLQTEQNVPFSRVLRVELVAGTGDDRWTYRLQRPNYRAREVRVEVEGPGCCPLPQTILLPEIDLARRLAAAIEASRQDPPFQRARLPALWLFGGIDTPSDLPGSDVAPLQ